MRNGNLIQFCAGRYYQGSGVLMKLGAEAARLGSRALVVVEPALWMKVEKRVTQSLREAGVAFFIWPFSGGCCPANYLSAAQAGREADVQMVIGVGGGRAMDCAKIASDKMGVRSITVPTSAATCAASAWLAVEYTDQGAFVGNYWTQYPPFAVFSDLDILASDCPLRYQAAGVVDAMAKYPEISYNIRYSSLWEKNVFSQSAQLLSHSTYKLLLENGAEMLEQLRKRNSSQLLEDCLCAAIQLTGLISSMACGGKQAAVSHSLYSYFCTHHPEITAKFLHGEMVGASLVYQLAANGADVREQRELEQFLQTLGVPACMRDLGLQDNEEERNALFTYLASNMPVESAEELDRLKDLQEILFCGLSKNEKNTTF